LTHRYLMRTGIRMLYCSWFGVDIVECRSHSLQSMNAMYVLSSGSLPSSAEENDHRPQF
jgi:hypothetical protein